MQSNRICIVALSIALAAVACHKHVPTAVLPPVPPPGPGPAPALPAPGPARDQPNLPPPPTFVSPLEAADRAFSAGKYDDARMIYLRLLDDQRFKDQRDMILFHVGLTYVLPAGPTADWKQGTSAFKELVESYPESPYKPLASLFLSLRSDLDHAAADGRQRDQKIKQLTTELERYKKIDADRRRRP
jgi:hypothetical protein